MMADLMVFPMADLKAVQKDARMAAQRAYLLVVHLAGQMAY